MIDLTKPVSQAPEFVEYARVHCRDCGDMPLSQEMYRAEMMRPDSRWSCPQCGGVADFDDAHWEELHYPTEPVEDPSEGFDHDQCIREYLADAKGETP